MGAAPGSTARKPLADRYRSIYEAVAAIPRGCVSSYGEVAGRAGLPRGARLVGRALAECPGSVPWHRVLNAAGRISLARGSPSYTRQVKRLEAEGVKVRDGKVASRYFRWRPDTLDALLWGPDAPAAGGKRRSRRSAT